MDDTLSSHYGMTFHPFCSDIPVEAMTTGKQLDGFLFRVQQQLRDGGFIAVTGEPGTGKSTALRIVAERLDKVADAKVGILTRPQSNNADFYRALSTHAHGNLRAMMTMADHLLSHVVQHDLGRIDEQVFFDVFQQPVDPEAEPKKRAGRKR